jgi:hypothetical protein
MNMTVLVKTKRRQLLRGAAVLAALLFSLHLAAPRRHLRKIAQVKGQRGRGFTRLRYRILLALLSCFLGPRPIRQVEGTLKPISCPSCRDPLRRLDMGPGRAQENGHFF